MPRSNALYYDLQICYHGQRRQVVLPMGSPLHPRTNGKEGDHMTDYELIMIMLTFLTLLIAVERKNSK